MPDVQNNLAGLRVLLDGVDLTDKIAPRLLSLNLTEKRGGEADQLDLVLHDHDGRLAIPPAGARIAVSIGWLKGSEVHIGMVDKGSFVVDDAEHSGPPDIITLRARSADLTADYRIRKDRSFKATTLGAVVTQIAQANGLKASIAPELASIEIPVLAQGAKSDMALVRELGRRHDAVATVKAGRLIFSPIGRGTTPSGRAIPGATIARREGDAHRYKRVERETYEGVTASWHDQGAATRKTTRAGAAGMAKRLKRVYATEGDAKAASDAEWNRIQRGAAEFDFRLALGRPDLFPDRAVTVTGFKPEIDARKWLIAEVTHTLDGQGGLATALKLETAV